MKRHLSCFGYACLCCLSALFYIVDGLFYSASDKAAFIHICVVQMHISCFILFTFKTLSYFVCSILSTYRHRIRVQVKSKLVVQHECRPCYLFSGGAYVTVLHCGLSSTHNPNLSVFSLKYL